MVDYQKYYEKLQNRIGETMSADKILEEPWWNIVVRELNLMSYYCARDFNLETGIICEKKYVTGAHAYYLPLEEWPPMRLMALTLILSYWLGRESQYHGLDQGLNWILDAYASGKLAYDEYQKAKEDKEKAEAAKKTVEEAVEKEASTDANAKTANSS
jgi:hypothetical protein